MDTRNQQSVPIDAARRTSRPVQIPARSRPADAVAPVTSEVDVPRWWEWVSFTIAHSFVSLLFHCFSLKGLYRFGRFFGAVEWRINFKRRRRFVTAFVRTVGGHPSPRERRRATREYFLQSRCDKLFYLILDRLPREQAACLFEITNKNLLDDALSRGCGVYIALAHHGPHHIAAILLSLHGYRVAGVRNRDESGIRRFVQQRMESAASGTRNFRILYSDSYPRDIYRCFQENYVLGSLMDVSRVPRPNQKFEEVSVFGETRRFLSGPMRIALRSGAPVLQAFIVPERDFRYRLDIIEELVDPETVDGENESVSDAIRRYAANVERHVRATPSLITRL